MDTKISLNDWHGKIKTVLNSLDTEILRKNKTVFAGGTKIVFDIGDYRWSRDMDFQISDMEAYSKLRTLVKENGLGSLFQPSLKFRISHIDPVIDQYGIRFFVDIDGTKIKLEIVREDRYKVNHKGMTIPGINALSMTREDSMKGKILANSDRFAVEIGFGRDIIDIGMMSSRFGTNMFNTALMEASKPDVYGQVVSRDIIKAIKKIFGNKNWREKCFRELMIKPEYQKEIITGLREAFLATKHFMEVNGVIIPDKDFFDIYEDGISEEESKFIRLSPN